MFFLIHIQGAEHSYTILSLAGAIFVIPFILFASLAGTLADRYSKRFMIYCTRVMEVLITCLGMLAFAFKSVISGYAILFLLSLHSTIFSPCKYGIIPEIVPKQKIPHYNGIISATTYLAIILGTFFASFLTQLTHENFTQAASFTFFIALTGALASLGLQKTTAQAAFKKLSINFFSGIFSTLRRARERRYLFPTIVFGAYFLFMGAYVQLNMIPFALQSLNMSEVQGGYLFLMTAIGIGLGSFCAGQLSGYEAEVGFVPIGALGSAICFILLYLFHSYFYAIVILLFFLGVFGGFFIVPIEIFIQVASPDADRGENVAAANFLSFIGVILASFVLAFLGNGLGLSAAAGFGVIGIITLIVTLLLGLLFADQVCRLGLFVIGSLFWNLKVVGKRRLNTQPPIVIVGQRRSWLDILIIMATLPRQVRYIVPTEPDTRRHPLYYKLFKVIPLDTSYYAPIGEPVLDEIKKELSQGHSVCIMHPIVEGDPKMKEWREQVEDWLTDTDVHAMPLYISHGGSLEASSRWRQFFTLFGTTVKVGFGLPIDF
ncbi:MAG: MFS transporter [Verrucomicrobia bacterium]|nr:MFS transporter [Verrucomicrobiota bacterium]